MITEDYVSFETAKLLKEKGFDEKCNMAYFNKTLVDYTMFGFCLGGDLLDCPTLQMAMKWLREIHKIDITVDPHDVESDWIYQFHLCQNKDYLFSRDVDTSYENCAEAAIKYCLENLI